MSVTPFDTKPFIVLGFFSSSAPLFLLRIEQPNSQTCSNEESGSSRDVPGLLMMILVPSTSRTSSALFSFYSSDRPSSKSPSWDSFLVFPDLLSNLHREQREKREKKINTQLHSVGTVITNDDRDRLPHLLFTQTVVLRPAFRLQRSIHGVTDEVIVKNRPPPFFISMESPGSPTQLVLHIKSRDAPPIIPCNLFLRCMFTP